MGASSPTQRCLALEYVPIYSKLSSHCSTAINLTLKYNVKTSKIPLLLSFSLQCFFVQFSVFFFCNPRFRNNRFDILQSLDALIFYYNAFPKILAVQINFFNAGVGKLFGMADRFKSENFSGNGFRNKHKYSAIKFYFSSHYNSDSIRTMSLFCSN